VKISTFQLTTHIGLVQEGVSVKKNENSEAFPSTVEGSELKIVLHSVFDVTCALDRHPVNCFGVLPGHVYVSFFKG